MDRLHTMLLNCQYNICYIISVRNSPTGLLIMNELKFFCLQFVFKKVASQPLRFSSAR